MSDYLLADRAESAFVAVLTPPIRTLLGLSATAFVPVVPGKYSGPRETYMVTCSCDIEEEETRGTGNFWVNAVIQVQCSAARQPGQVIDPKNHDTALLSIVNYALFVSDLEAQLSVAVEDFHVFNSSVQRTGGARTQNAEANCWQDTITLRFLACARNLTDGDNPFTYTYRLQLYTGTDWITIGTDGAPPQFTLAGANMRFVDGVGPQLFNEDTQLWHTFATNGTQLLLNPTGEA